MVAGRTEHIPPVRRIYVEEDAGYDNRLLFQKFLEERETIVYGLRKVLQVEPNVKRCHRRNCDLEPNVLQPLQYMIALRFEVLLEGYFLFGNMLWVQKWNSRQL